MIDLKLLPSEPTYHAPDHSEIRLLHSFQSGGICHCTLPVGKTSLAVKHKTIKEIWYCISGSGSIWQRAESEPEGDEKKFGVGHCFTIPTGCSFQFKNTGNEPLCIIIATMPEWPGDDEAVFVEGAWT